MLPTCAAAEGAVAHLRAVLVAHADSPLTEQYRASSGFARGRARAVDREFLERFGPLIAAGPDGAKADDLVYAIESYFLECAYALDDCTIAMLRRWITGADPIGDGAWSAT